MQWWIHLQRNAYDGYGYVVIFVVGREASVLRMSHRTNRCAPPRRSLCPCTKGVVAESDGDMHYMEPMEVMMADETTECPPPATTEVEVEDGEMPPPGKDDLHFSYSCTFIVQFVLIESILVLI